MKADKIAPSAMLFLLGILLSAVTTSPASAQPAMAFCIDARGQNGDSMPVPIREYAIALLSDTIQRVGNNRVVAKATVLIKAPPNFARELYPVVFVDQGDLVVQCKHQIEPSRFLRDVTLETTRPGDADDLVSRLAGLTDRSIVQKAKDVQSWPTFILFKPNGFQPIGALGRQPLESLYRNYRGLDQDPAFLAGVPYRVKLTSQFANPQPHVPDVAGGNPQQAGGPQQQAAGPQQQPIQRQTTQPPRGRQDILQPQQPAQGGAAATPRPVQQTVVNVTIRFRANHDQWQALLDPEQLRTDAGIFDTFTYCSGMTAAGSGAYKLQCTLRPDRKFPLRIRGFKELLVDPEGPPIDDQLQVVGFAYPYPVSWRRPQSEFIEVQGGSLREVLARKIPLSQGIVGCQTEIAAVSIANIVSGALQFPAEPCKAYDISFRQLLLSPSASALKGCIAGFPDQAVPIQNNRVTCWARSAQTEPFKVNLQLFNGFGPVDITIRTLEDVEFAFADLARALRPLWPYAQPGIVNPAQESPAYSARAIQFTGENGTPCGRALALTANGPDTLPTLDAAGCGEIPRGMTMVLEQEGAPQNNPSAPPPQAFKARHDDAIELAKATPNRTIPVEQLKLQLPVRFSAEDTVAFNAQFGTGAGNSQSLSGVFLFQGNCTTKREGKFVPFNGQPTPATYKWPIKAAVFDGSDDPLTLCTTATVGGVQSGTPYLTFGLRGARAVGHRRAIVISMSPNLANRGGTKALQESLRTFVDQIHAEVTKGARLSPINVFQVNGAGEFKQLFTGEAAAQDREGVIRQLGQSQENVAPVTPDFRQLRLAPELRKDSQQNFDRVVFVMDGSDAAQENMDVLAGLANQFKDRDKIHLLMTGSCNPWLQQNQNITCTQLPADATQRPDQLVKAFAKFINPTELQAANPQGELRPSVQPAQGAAPAPVAAPAPPPAATPQGGKGGGAASRR